MYTKRRASHVRSCAAPALLAERAWVPLLSGRVTPLPSVAVACLRLLRGASHVRSCAAPALLAERAWVPLLPGRGSFPMHQVAVTEEGSGVRGFAAQIFQGSPVRGTGLLFPGEKVAKRGASHVRSYAAPALLTERTWAPLSFGRVTPLPSFAVAHGRLAISL